MLYLIKTAYQVGEAIGGEGSALPVLSTEKNGVVLSGSLEDVKLWKDIIDLTTLLNTEFVEGEAGHTYAVRVWADAAS